MRPPGRRRPCGHWRVADNGRRAWGRAALDAKHLFELALSVVNPESSVAEPARKHGSTAAEIEEWPERSFAAVENALRARPK